MLRKYAGLEEGFVLKHLILICFTQQAEMLSFLQDFLFPSRDWKPLGWLLQERWASSPWSSGLGLLSEKHITRVLACTHYGMHISVWASKTRDPKAAQVVK